MVHPDDAEWRARPDRWGIFCLPYGVRERKNALFDHHLHTGLAECVPCAICREPVRDLVAEDGCDLIITDDWIRDWYGRTHAGQECEVWDVWRACQLHRRRAIGSATLLERMVEVLHEVALTSPRTPERFRGRDLLDWRREIVVDLVGPSPFTPVAFDPGWRTDTVTALAGRMYEAREFGAMPILADALEDAGCDSPAVLDHCRGDGRHVRGCWVVDGLLEKG